VNAIDKHGRRRHADGHPHTQRPDGQPLCNSARPSETVNIHDDDVARLSMSLT